MYKKLLFFVAVLIGITLNSCSKKTVPQRTATVTPGKNNTSGVKIKKPVAPPVVKTIDSTVTIAPEKPEEKPVEKEKPKQEFPKVITVNDAAASKSVDGRLFYDVLGHRYWKNYKDGKYYLFDKSMYSNPDFTPKK
jgi:hypothetical protein